MSIISSVKGIFTGAKDTKSDAVVKSEETPKISREDKDICSNAAAQAIRNQVESTFSSEHSLKTTDCSNLIGTMFPDVDSKPITKEYISFRKEGIKTLLDTEKLYHNAVVNNDYSDIKDENGNLIAAFLPDVQETYMDAKGKSIIMYEYDPISHDIVAQTKIFRTDGQTGADWDRENRPLFERISYDKNGDTDTYLTAILSRREDKNGNTRIVPQLQVWASGFKNDGGYDTHSAKQYLSRIMHTGYESYRQDYSAPCELFCCGSYTHAALTKTGGVKGEEFKAALEYPHKQLVINNSAVGPDGFPYTYGVD